MCNPIIPASLTYVKIQMEAYKENIRSYSSMLTYVRRHLLVKLIVAFLIGLVLFRLIKPNYFSYGLSYAKIIIEFVNTDMQRQMNVTTEEAQEQKKMKKVAWLISMSGNGVLPGAVAVGHIINKFSCFPTMIALVSDTVSKASRSALTAVGFGVHVVEALDCFWMAKKIGFESSGGGFRIPGTHTRFHAWRFTQYETIIYVDTDFFPLINMDELFDSPGEFSAVYCARPGVLDPCFNAGLVVFKPSAEVYQALMEKWEELTRVLGCPNDQVVQWYYFAFNGRWNPLPYSYNVRRKIYYPMKAYHFAGYGTLPKPWELTKPPTRKEVHSFPGPALTRGDMDVLWWKSFYEALDDYNLHDWWKTTNFYQPPTEDATT